MTKSVTWKIGGEAGFGIMSAGLMISKSFARLGYHTFATNEYPSLIRGGHNIITVRISSESFSAMNTDLHILTGLNKESIALHISELKNGSLVMYDPKDYLWQDSEFPCSVSRIEVPFSDLVSSFGGDKVMRNTVALGATIALLGVDLSSFESVIRDQFGKKGEEVITQNISIAKAGYDHIKKMYPAIQSTFLEPLTEKKKRLIINASEAVGVGAVRAGLKFAAIYPMTPINSLITFLADHAKEYGIVYKQPEDEIAGITMAIGASVAGVRSMVATSGGGYALMVEGTSLAGIMEVPVVIDMGMRPGPATGMPTWTEQAELRFIIHAGHGEFPKIVLAPADAGDAYQATIDAFNLADKYQTPVFVLTDKYMNESLWCVDEELLKKDVSIDRGKVVTEESLPTDDSFKRYRTDVDDGISPRSYFGMKHGWYACNSYEHDQVGLVTESPDQRVIMADKRMRKMLTMKQDIQPPRVYGDKDFDITLVTWGSVRGVALEAMKLLQSQGKKVRVIHYMWVYPFPVEQTQKLLTQGGRVIDIELNGTAQLHSLIREHTGIDISEKLLQYNGRMFYPEQIVDFVLKGTL